MLRFLQEKLSMPDDKKKRHNVSGKKAHRLEDLMNTLKSDCVKLYESGKYFNEIQDDKRTYDEIFPEALETCRKVNQMKWEKEPELLKIFKAKANCFIGRVWEQKAEYDRALECMDPARQWIEHDMLEYIIPEFYVEINRCMAKCYMEKNSDTKKIYECLNHAKDILQDEKVKEDIKARYNENYCNALILELNLQYAIVNLDSYGQKKHLEIASTWEYLKTSEKYFKELRDVKYCEIKAWKEWYRIQDATLATTKGEYFKKLYFETVQVQKELKKLKTHKAKKNSELVVKKMNEWHDMMKSIAEIIPQDIKLMEKEMLPPGLADNQIDQSKYQRLSIMKKKLHKLKIKDKPLKADNSGLEYLKKTTGKLKNICFKVAFITYAEVVNREPDNTMCLGGMAGLLYDKYKKDKEYDEYKELMNVWCPDFEKKSLEGLLDQILEVENCNMYALNIKDALSSEKFGEIGCYAALRQSSLKRKFRRMDGELWGVFDDKTRKKYMLRIMPKIISLYREVVGFMNSAIVDCGPKKWGGLQIGHYTRLDVVPKLINRDGDSMYRLYNAHHMNDNREGVLLIDHLRKRIDSRKSSLIGYIMDKYTYDQNGAVRSYVYIGSFTSGVDDMDMWRSYGDKGKGVCLQFDAAHFFDCEAKYSFADIAMIDGTSGIKMEDTRYPLYMVVYLPDKDGSIGTDMQKKDSKGVDGKDKALLKDTLKKAQSYAKRRADAEKENPLERHWWKKQAYLIKRLGNVEKKIKDCLYDIGKVYDEMEKNTEGEEGQLEAFKKELSGTIMVIIDLIRFLIKRDHFKNEREYRVIQYSSDPQYEDADTGIPRLFIPMEKAPLYKRIYFGSAVTDFDSKAAYILNIRKNRKDVEERKTWDIEVCKSSVPIREV